MSLTEWARRALVVPAAVAVMASGISSAPVATAQSHPFVDVQVGAAVRTTPLIRHWTLDGYVLNMSHFGVQTQRSWVKCWEDGDWATGNYTTNRWFKVFVNDSKHGEYARWGYVHASYVYNQKPVPRCR